MALADFELTAPDGRRVLLKDDGTWQYLDADKGKDKGKEKEAARPKDAGKGKDADKLAEADKSKEPPKPVPEALMRMQRKLDIGGSCHFLVQLENTLPFEIRSIVPAFSAYRPNGVVYQSVSMSFQWVKPGDSQTKELVIRGLGCQEIVRIQVEGGDRCVMGDLDRFSEPNGQCLSHIQVQTSDLVRFDK
jgi:hypothetical protein